MFVLDTNVISELMSDNPWPTVLTWVDEQRASDLFVTAITEAEIRTGVALLPEGRRRRGLTEATERTFGKLYAGRVLPFGSEAACVYATIAAARRAAGRPICRARLPDCGDCPLVRRDGRNPQRPGFRWNRSRRHQPVDRRMNL